MAGLAAKMEIGGAGDNTRLDEMVDGVIEVITNDGRCLMGILRGYDQATNLILADASERVYSTKAGVEQVPLGLYMIRGNNVAVVGLIDEDKDAGQDMQTIRAAPLKPITH
mmetsp:Transcript_21123/g.35995  ORF Transcript_21123/g.35995 Transcript_21123/m.35995 type:complete len:111 (+) Transcript_21123:136-468(+)